MNIDEILDLMDGLLDKSSSVPFSNKRMIDCEQNALSILIQSD